MAVKIKRVPVTNAKAEVVVGADGELGGTAEYTILNTHATKSVELVEAPTAAWASGFPLVPGAAWSARCSPSEKVYVIAQDGTSVSVAVIGIQVP